MPVEIEHPGSAQKAQPGTSAIMPGSLGNGCAHVIPDTDLLPNTDTAMVGTKASPTQAIPLLMIRRFMG